MILATSVLAEEPQLLDLEDGRTFHHLVLPNGLEVSVLEVPDIEIVATQVWYHVGAAHEGEGSRGLAHLFEHLMFGPNDVYGKDAVFRFHTRHGGRNNAYTSFDETVYVSEIAPPHHLEVLAMEAARMDGLTLTREELENEQRIVTEELRVSTENDPFARVMVAALAAVLGDHPYALTPVGTKEDIASATVESCERFYRRYYRPGNAHVVVAGPVDVTETLSRIEELFGNIETAPVHRPPVPSLLDWEFRSETVLREDLPPVETAILGFPLPPLDHPDADALTLLRLMTTGAADPFREELVRRHGKALEAGVEVFLARRGGALAFYSAHLPYRRRKTAFAWIERSLAAVEASLTEERLDSAKRSFLSGEYLGRYYADTQASRLGASRWNRGAAEDAFRQRERVRAVTLGDVRGVWRRYVVDQQPFHVYLKPEKVPLTIRLFGWLYPLVS